MFLLIHLDPFVRLDVVQCDGGGGFVHQNCGHWLVGAGGCGHTDRHQPQITFTCNQTTITVFRDSLQGIVFTGS